MVPLRLHQPEICFLATGASYHVNSAAALRAFAGVAVVDAAPSGRVCFATAKAQALLMKYCASPYQLPPTLMRCVANQYLNGVARLLPWTAEAGTEQLIVKLTGKVEGYLQLFLEERGDVLTTECLQETLSLTPREAEVLIWISKGKTSPEIASIVGCKSTTVNKHTQSIFSKLGVETRTAAAAVAIELIR